MRKTDETFELLANTCRQIVASPLVIQFVVGITTNPAVRRQRYRRWARTHENGPATLDGFVVLDWGYNQADIERVERYLFKALVDHPNYGVIDMDYKRSVYRKGENADNQVVYLAWWSAHLVEADPT